MAERRRSILVVCSILPYPPRAQGFAIRYAPILETLKNDFDVHLLVISKEVGVEEADLGPLETCASVRRQARNHERALPVRLFRFVRSLLPGSTPYDLVALDDAVIVDALREASERIRPDVVVVPTTDLIDAALQVFPGERIIWDPIDSVALHASRLVSGGHGTAKVRRLQAWERRVAARVAATAYISAADARFSHGEAPPYPVRVIPNGVLISGGDSVRAPFTVPDAPTIGFLGNMSYAPNVRAALELVNIFTEVRRQVPSARLKIIGRDPVESLRACASTDIEITGTVDDVWAHIADVDVFAFPLWTGAGLQNKLLEAMFARRPVVCTPTANAGIEAADHREVLVADSASAFAEALVFLLTNHDRAHALGDAGHDLIAERFMWSGIIPQVRALWTAPITGAAAPPRV